MAEDQDDPHERPTERTLPILKPGIMIEVLRECARCGGEHRNLAFLELKRPFMGGNRSVLFTHWCLCPTTGEPILNRIAKLS